MDIRARAALLDIEGTLGSMSFVHNVLFPYAQERMDAYVHTHRNDPDVRAILNEAAMEARVDANDLAAILHALHDWTKRDVKVTSLKALQGLIWVGGFESRGIRGHLYEDSIAALRRFHEAGIQLAIYSSGSIAAQKLLFGHSVAGDLTPLFSGFYDTTIGSKRTRSSYDRIVDALAVPAGEVVFFSDNTAELDAAAEAGLQTIQLARPEDGVAAGSNHPAVSTFDGIILSP